MHDVYAPIDVMCCLVLLATVGLAIRIRRRVQAKGRQMTGRDKRSIVAYLAWAVFTPLFYRWFHYGAEANLASFTILIANQIVNLRESAVRHERWIQRELAAGRVPKECRVYNDWARPDPE